ncbi:MAG TPA: hypothetical protein G4O02_16185, partial [Caldilineae bacterium]|nr:hypothetical protein [Caldilineae bacterium]
AFFAAFLKEQEERYNRESSTLADISIEIGNIEAAWRWTTQLGDAATALPLCTGLFFIGDMWGWLGLVQPLFVQGVETLQAHLRAEEQEPTQLDAIAILIARILHAQGSLLMRRGRLSAAFACARQAEAFARQAERSPPQTFALIYARSLRAIILGMRNEFDESERIFREEQIPYWETATTSEFQGPDFSLGNAYMGLGAILVARGHYNAARQVLERSLAVKERSGEFRFRALTYSFLARAYAGQGRCTEGLDAAVEGERLSREFDDRFSLSSALVTTGRLLLANDKVNAARRRCLEAMEVAEETGNRFILAWARIWLANVALAEKRVTEATSLATDALALYQREEMESIDLLSEILLAQGKCALAAGQPEAAEESFRRMQALPRCSAPYRQAAEEALAAVQAGRAFET